MPGSDASVNARSVFRPFSVSGVDGKQPTKHRTCISAALDVRRSIVVVFGFSW